MKKLLVLCAPLLTLPLLASPRAPDVGPHSAPGTYHVDYQAGNDAAAGTTPATAWKHAPGDPNARGTPARLQLLPGDRIRFAAGVRYRGEIRIRTSGSAAAPIVFEGAGPGATIDGSEPVSFRTCLNSAECGGAANWSRLVRLDLPSAATAGTALFTASGPMRFSQEPDPEDDFYYQEIENFPEADGVALSRGQLTLPRTVADGLRRGGGGKLALWVVPNRVVERPITTIEGDVARYDPTGLRHYTDRPSRAAAVNHVSLIDQPGEFATLPGGRVAVAMVAQGTKSISVANGRAGFVLRDASRITVRDLVFENMADGDRYAPGGVGVFAERGSHIRIEGNRFRNFVMVKGQGAIIVRKVNDLAIHGNRIEGVVLGSGMRLSGPAERIAVERNEIHRVGRTAIMLMGVSDAMVRRNLISDVRGVHGNGLSAYSDNSRISFVANTVLDAKQPATFQGAGAAASMRNDLLFANNLLVATPGSLGALISFGNVARGVVIRNNVLLGGRAGLRLSAKDSGLLIADNVAAGLLVGSGAVPSDWRITGNAWTALTFQQAKEVPRPVVPPGLAEAALDLQRGRVPGAICAVIRRNGAGSAKAGKPEDARAIGARLSCG